LILLLLLCSAHHASHPIACRESELTEKQRMILEPPSVPGSQRLSEWRRNQKSKL
jgi:hypothetical protein